MNINFRDGLEGCLMTEYDVLPMLYFLDGCSFCFGSKLTKKYLMERCYHVVTPAARILSFFVW